MAWSYPPVMIDPYPFPENEQELFENAINFAEKNNEFAHKFNKAFINRLFGIEAKIYTGEELIHPELIGRFRKYKEKNNVTV